METGKDTEARNERTLLEEKFKIKQAERELKDE